MVACGLQAKIVAVTVEGRRDEDGAVYARRVHHPDHGFRVERHGQMRALGSEHPRPFRRIGRPDMDLRVDDDRRRSGY
jgi:hypothetical protein